MKVRLTFVPPSPALYILSVPNTSNSSTSSISFPFKLLRTLPRSCRSFSTCRPLFSIHCALFLQNTGGMGIPNSFSVTSLLCETSASLCLCVVFFFLLGFARGYAALCFALSDIRHFLFSATCSLLFRSLPSDPFVFNRLRPLFQKHPGWGYSRKFPARS